MNQKFIQSALLGASLAGLLAFGNFNANAMGFNKNISNDGKVNNNGKVVSANAFYTMLDQTKPAEVATKFGMPDTITTLKSASGAKEGVVWTYKDAVKQDTATLSANFVFVAGEFKYVTLSNS